MWTPPSHVRAQQERRRRHNATLLKQFETHGTLAEFNAELRRIDPDLELMRAPDHDVHPAIKPGFYHVVRHNEDAPMLVEPFQSDDGAFLDPLLHRSYFFRWLERADLWSDRVRRERDRLSARAQAAWQRAQEREAEDLDQEVTDRLKALEPGVSFANQGKGKWTYRAGARRQ